MSKHTSKFEFDFTDEDLENLLERAFVDATAENEEGDSSPIAFVPTSFRDGGMMTRDRGLTVRVFLAERPDDAAEFQITIVRTA